MSFLQKILQKLPWKGSPSPGPRIYLAAFGKHPGWDDHMEDLGIETPLLVEVKRLLYLQGIGGNIDSGRWDKLDDSLRAPPFAHLFLWRVGREIIAGRIWSSRDGKGRTHYPMIVCAQCGGLTWAWVFAQVLPALSEVESQCVQAATAVQVRSVLDAARARLRQGAALAGDASACEPSPVEGAAVLALPQMGRHPEGFYRILYQLDSACRARSAGRTALLRVPAGGATAEESAWQWLSLLGRLLGEQTPVLLILPVQGGWADVIVGDEPSVTDLFSIRAPPGVIPLTSEIPYNLEQGFVAQAQRIMRDLFGPGGSGPADAGPIPPLERPGG